MGETGRYIKGVVLLAFLFWTSLSVSLSSLTEYILPWS